MTLSLLPLAPIVAAFLARRASSREEAWRIAAAAAVITLLGALAVAGWVYATDPRALVRDALVPGLAVDGLTGVVLPFVAALGAAVILFPPPSRRSREEVAALLLAEGSYLAMFLAATLDWLVIAWVGSFAWTLERRFEPGVTRRPLVALAVGSSLPLLFAWGALLATGQPRDVATLVAHPLPNGLQVVVYGGCALAMLIRTGAVPFQSWQVASVSRASLGLPVFLVAARPAAYLMLRVAIPVAPAVHAAAAPYLQGIALATALYGGLLGLVQTDLRRALAALAVTHSGLVYSGLCASDPVSIVGAEVQWLNVGVSLLGIALVVDALESRLGRERLATGRGLATRLPGLTLVFLLFGISAAGFPGTLGFVGEDLLVRGTMGPEPWVALGVTLATTLNGVTLVRIFFRVFLGPPDEDLPWPATLVPRERWVMVPLLAFVVGCGIVPAPLVWSRSAEVVAQELLPQTSP